MQFIKKRWHIIAIIIIYSFIYYYMIHVNYEPTHKTMFSMAGALLYLIILGITKGDKSFENLDWLVTILMLEAGWIWAELLNLNLYVFIALTIIIFIAGNKYYERGIIPGIYLHFNNLFLLFIITTALHLGFQHYLDVDGKVLSVQRLEREDAKAFLKHNKPLLLQEEERVVIIFSQQLISRADALPYIYNLPQPTTTVQAAEELTYTSGNKHVTFKGITKETTETLELLIAVHIPAIITGTINELTAYAHNGQAPQLGKDYFLLYNDSSRAVYATKAIQQQIE